MNRFICFLFIVLLVASCSSSKVPDVAKLAKSPSPGHAYITGSITSVSDSTDYYFLNFHVDHADAYGPATRVIPSNSEMHLKLNKALNRLSRKEIEKLISNKTSVQLLVREPSPSSINENKIMWDVITIKQKE